MDPVDIDPTFEPQQRARSNTWPLPRPDNYVEKDDGGEQGASGGGGGGGGLGGNSLQDGKLPPGSGDASHLPKKNSSRRNAWGNMSYADLITQAINSCPDKRLTLSQIYDWMVQNVPYFKDKGDSNSSAGWKNSIRHNLSLHNRFMRVQNEGTGKSSWWMINPDAKPGKAARRRATSMETQKYEKKRGRVKKKVEALRNGMDTTPSPSSSISESLDMFPDSPIHPAFQLSPDFRPRASSNASSCGRLSPIPAVESDMHDSQVPPMSPIPWGSEMGSTSNLASLYGNGGSLDRYGPDQLVDTLAETMKLGGDGSYLTDCGLKTSPTGQLSPHSHLHNLQPPTGQSSPGGSNGYGLYGGGGAHTPGTRYGDFPPSFQTQNDTAKLSPQRLLVDMSTSYNITSLQALSPAHSVHSVSPPHSVDLMPHSQPPPTSHRPTDPVLSPHSTAYRGSSSAGSSPSGYCALSPATGQQQATSMTPAESAMLRAALTHKEALAAAAASNGIESGGGGGGGNITNGGCVHITHPQPPPPPPPPSSLRGTSSSISHMMGQLVAINNGIPNDLDFSLDALQGGLECDVDQVIRHELSVDGNLDFNFPESNSATQSLSLPTTIAAANRATGGQQWVH